MTPILTKYNYQKINFLIPTDYTGFLRTKIRSNLSSHSNQDTEYEY